MPFSTRIALRDADPLAVVIRERELQQLMCSNMERLADQLGGLTDIQLCMSLSRQLREELPLLHHDEEALYAVVRQGKLQDNGLFGSLDLATYQHAILQAYAYELLEPLEDIIHGARLKNIDTVGYMLRYGFDMIRSHMDWEDVAILTKITANMPLQQQEKLRQAMLRNR